MSVMVVLQKGAPARGGGFGAPGQPSEYCPHVRHVGRAAYLAHGLSDRDLGAATLDDLRIVFF
jgi:hypothetical protein